MPKLSYTLSHSSEVLINSLILNYRNKERLLAYWFICLIGMYLIVEK